jgi:hypothetical protein
MLSESICHFFEIDIRVCLNSRVPSFALLRFPWFGVTLMGLSFSTLFNSFSTLLKREKDVRMLMLGLDSAGKTTILYRLQVKSPTFCPAAPELNQFL